MDGRAVISALGRLGGRATVVDTCPMCGRPVTEGHERVRAWPGKLAHARCARYVRSAHRHRRAERQPVE